MFADIKDAVRGGLRRRLDRPDRERRLQPSGAGAGRRLARGGPDPHPGPLSPADRASTPVPGRAGRGPARVSGAWRGDLLTCSACKFDPATAAMLDAARRPAAAADRTRSPACCRTSRAWTTTGSLRRLALLVGAIKRTNFYQRAEDGAAQALHLDSRSPRASWTTCRCPSPIARSSSGRRTSRACTCASARWRAAACAGPTAATTSAPRCWAWSRRSRSRTRSSCRSAPRAASIPKQLPRGRRPRRHPAPRRSAPTRPSCPACWTSPTTSTPTARSIHPDQVVIVYEGDDPYLVVAADKGTATFSDIANGVSADYGFWLGDAFASGGSVGYDHKVMGITARGAWEAVKRHFREMGKDIQTEPFTVVGVGDMSGDVFGNGMLLSQADPPDRRLRSPPHLHRPRPGPGRSPGSSASGCSSCRARPGRTTTRARSRRAAASSRARRSRSR